MNSIWFKPLLLAPLLVAFACSTRSQTSTQDAAAQLGGTSWQLVKFQGGDGKILTPDDRGKYTISFGADGSVSARIDCNRGRGTWKSQGPNQLEFGPMALTRAMCSPGSLHDQIVKNWNFVRSYLVKDDHLFLSLMADGGIYEFEPPADAKSGSTNADKEQKWLNFRCPDGQTVMAQFHLPQDQLVDVRFAARELRLPHVISGSGARYSDGKTTFWNKGRSVLMEVDDKIVVQDCMLEAEP